MFRSNIDWFSLWKRLKILSSRALEESKYVVKERRCLFILLIIWVFVLNSGRENSVYSDEENCNE